MDIRKINIFYMIKRTVLILLVLALLAVGLFWCGPACRKSRKPDETHRVNR